MPRLTKIYTRKGDQGLTSLGDRSRVPKESLRVEAYGTVDELNSALGLAIALEVSRPLHTQLKRIQNQLFDLGADLAFPTEDDSGKLIPHIEQAQIDWLEKEIDRMNAELGPLENFILPGGRSSAAALQLARTICRRAERQVAALSRTENLGRTTLPYLNRLSDALFVMARFDNHLSGVKEPLWGEEN